MSAGLSSPKAAIPSHVPPELVIDFDYIDDPTMYPDPYAGMASIARDAPPIFFSPYHGGSWVAAQHQPAFDIARNTEIFSSYLGEPMQIPIFLDPPDHTAYRAVLNTAFSPQRMRALGDSVRELAGELIDKVAARGSCEFLTEIAEPLPIMIFMKIVGLPIARYRDLRDWVVAAMSEGDQSKAAIYYQNILEVTGETIRARQAKREDDVISQLIDARVRGEPLTFDQLQSYSLLLVIAGLDTVISAMSLGMRHLAAHGDLQSDLRAAPEKIPDIIEEMLRRYPLTAPRRVVTRDFDYAGIPFRAGDVVVILLQAVNLDPRAYPNPESIDAQRNGEAPVVFGIGKHRCVGSHLARLELGILYEEWLRRIPDFRLDPENPPVLHGGYVMGVSQVPLLWDGDKIETASRQEVPA